MAKKSKFFTLATAAAITGVAVSGIITNNASAIGGTAGLKACEGALKSLDGTTATYGDISAEKYGEQTWKDWGVYQESYTANEEAYYKALAGEYHKDEVVVNYLNHKLRQNPTCAEYLGEYAKITPWMNGAVQGKASFYLSNAGPSDSSWKKTLSSLDGKYEIKMPIIKGGDSSGPVEVTGYQDTVTITIKAKYTTDLDSYYKSFIDGMHNVNYVFYGTDAVQGIFNLGETMNNVLKLKKYTDVMGSFPRAKVGPFYYTAAGGMGAAYIDRTIGEYRSVFVDDTYFGSEGFYASYAPVLVAPASTKDLAAFVKSKVSLPEGAKLKSFTTKDESDIESLLRDNVKDKIKADLGSTAKFQPTIFKFNYDDSGRISGMGADDMELDVAVVTISDEAYKGYSTSEKVVTSTDANTGVSFESTAKNIPSDAELFSKDVKSSPVVEKAIKKATEKIVAAFDLSLYSLTSGQISKFDGSVTVRVPVEEKYAGRKLAARYVTSDGKTPEADIAVKIVKDGKQYFAEFAVKHFSIYALVDDGIAVTPPNAGAGASEASSSVLASLVAAITISLAIVIMKKTKTVA